MTLPGADRLLRALEAVEDDATDRNVHLAAAELVLKAARPGSRSARVQATGKATATPNRGVVKFGSNKVPWTAPSHFGHGSRLMPRAQGGYMKANPWLFEALAKKENAVVDLYLTRTTKALRDNGL